MSDRQELKKFETPYPDYNVLDKWDTPSFNEATRRVVGDRMRDRAAAAAILQPDEYAAAARHHGYRPAAGRAQRGGAYPGRGLSRREARTPTPPTGRAMPTCRRNARPGGPDWRRSTPKREAECGRRFVDLARMQRHSVLQRIDTGRAGGAHWRGMQPKRFFRSVLLKQSVKIYYAHPFAWNEIGFGGPAAPRGYVRLGAGHARSVGGRARNVGRSARSNCRERRRIRRRVPPARRRRPRARRLPASARWVPMRQFRDDDAVDFADRRHRLRRRRARRQARRGGIFGRRLRRRRRSGGRSRTSPPTSASRTSSTGSRTGSPAATIRSSSAPTIPARPSAARRCISRWWRCASGRNGSRRARRSATARDWPVDWREMWRYYAEAEDATEASPARSAIPWGPKRGRYPYREHELNAAGAGAGPRRRGARRQMGADADSPPSRRRAARRHPCVYRGFCKVGCATNAKQCVLVTLCAARAEGRRGDPRPRHGRPHRDGATGRATGVALPSRGRVALPEGAATSSSPAIRSRRPGSC